jgi:hypothetical protein
VAGTTTGILGDDDFAVARYGRDLHLEKVAIPPTVRSGRIVKYRLMFGNSGAAARQVRIDDTVPPGVTVLGVVSSGVPITEVLSGPLYRWQVGKLGYGQGGVITVTGRVPATTVRTLITNTASIGTSDWDSYLANNEDVAGVTIVPFRVCLPVVLRSAAVTR